MRKQFLPENGDVLSNTQQVISAGAPVSKTLLPTVKQSKKKKNYITFVSVLARCLS